MSTIYDAAPPAQRLAVAVRIKGPAQLARAFAAQVGQFYDRTEFDALARRTSDLYAVRNPDDAGRFRSRLDRRLYDRYHAPVPWQLDTRRAAAAADSAAVASASATGAANTPSPAEAEGTPARAA
jgi:hypothetical protein